MIKVTDLCKVFRTEEIETTALDHVSFEIKDGEFHGPFRLRQVHAAQHPRTA